MADPLRFKLILYNLLSNAINFTENGSLTLRAILKIDHWEFQVIIRYRHRKKKIIIYNLVNLQE